MRIQSVLDAFAAQLLNNKLDLCAARCKAGIWHQMVAKSPTLLRVIKPQSTRPESRVTYLSRALPRAPGDHQICESISSARVLGCPPVAATLRFASFISSTRSPWDPSDLRVPYLPRAFWNAYRFLRPFRFTSFTSSARGPWDPSVLRVPYLPCAF